MITERQSILAFPKYSQYVKLEILIIEREFLIGTICQPLSLMTFLRRYLKIPEIPGDVARNNTVQDLLHLYQNLIDEFKDVHKRTRLLQKENAAEIINDIKEMAVERDIGKLNGLLMSRITNNTL